MRKANERMQLATDTELTQAEREMVSYYAWNLARITPPNVTAEDLISEGYVGLMKARRRFDADRGVKFATYAQPAVRGAMLDYLRIMGRNRRVYWAETVALDDCAEQICQRESPEDAAVYRLSLEAIGYAACRLVPRQRQALRLRYECGLTWDKVGEQMGITDARAWQLHRTAIAKLRKMLGG